jgi:putative PIN family toxin of toxin-antitoxin system
MSETQPARPVVVLDTNIVLDLWLYRDPATPALLTALQQRQINWVATEAMREELHRVLTYPHITERRSREHIEVDWMLAQFDMYASMHAEALRAPYVCKDPDDQKFIDLAVAHKALLLSKDKQVLRLTNRLARLSVRVTKSF